MATLLGSLVNIFKATGGEWVANAERMTVQKKGRLQILPTVYFNVIDSSYEGWGQQQDPLKNLQDGLPFIFMGNFISEHTDVDKDPVFR